MKKYCIGIFIIILVGLTIVPAFLYYATHNMAETDIFTKPGWLYSLALVTALISAYICERRSASEKKVLRDNK